MTGTRNVVYEHFYNAILCLFASAFNFRGSSERKGKAVKGIYILKWEIKKGKIISYKTFLFGVG